MASRMRGAAGKTVMRYNMIRLRKVDQVDHVDPGFFKILLLAPGVGRSLIAGTPSPR